MDYALESIVGKVDLRLPAKPPAIFFRGPANGEAAVAIRRSIGEGEIVTTAEEAPRFTIFQSRLDGCIDLADFDSAKRCFRKYGTEACVFEYLTIEKIFRLRGEDYFVPERIA